MYMNDNVNNSFRKEPDAEKPHVRICEGRTIVRGASTRPLAIFLKKKDQKKKNPEVPASGFSSPLRWTIQFGLVLSVISV